MVAGPDQLGGHPDRARVPPHAAQQHVLDPQLAPDPLRRLLGLLEVHHRGPGDHAEPRGIPVPQLGDHLLRQAVAEILLPLVAGQILKRQDRQHDPARRTVRSPRHATRPGRRRGARSTRAPASHACRAIASAAAGPARAVPPGRLGRRGIRRIEDRRHEAIPSAGDGLNETGLLGIVLEDLPDLADGAVDAVVHVQVGALAPDPLGDLLPGDQLARPLGQEQEDLQRDPLELERPARAPELVGRAVQLQLLAEANGLGGRQRIGRQADPREAGRPCVRKIKTSDRRPLLLPPAGRRRNDAPLLSPDGTAGHCHGLHQPSGDLTAGHEDIP